MFDRQSTILVFPVCWRLMLSRLLITIFMASAAAIGAGFAASVSREASSTSHAPARVVIEQRSAGSLAAALTTTGTNRLIDIAYDGRDAVLLSVPAHWKRLEVAGGALHDMIVEEEGLGYTRWSMQPGMRARFAASDAWSVLTLEQLSPVALQLRLRRINLQENTSTDEVILLMNELVALDPR